QTTANSAPLGYGKEGLNIPQALQVNVTSPRTVELLGEILSVETMRHRRVEIIRDIGACRMPQGLKYLVQGFSDSDPAIRAETSPAASALGDRIVLPKLEKLLRDPEATVRREAVLAGGRLGDESFFARGLDDPEPEVAAAACLIAKTSVDAHRIALHLASLP